MGCLAVRQPGILSNNQRRIPMSRIITPRLGRYVRSNFVQIKGQDRKWAVRVLECLAFSARLMTLEEVAEVVAFNPDSGQFDKEFPNPLAVLEICASLITIP